MVPRIGAAYAGKFIKDQLFAAPAEAAPNGDQPRSQDPVQQAVPTATMPVDQLDGQTILDDEGNAVGKARGVHGVSVYVVSPLSGNRESQLRQAIDDMENTKVYFHYDDDRLTGLIYVPDPDKAGAANRGTRSDDV